MEICKTDLTRIIKYLDDASVLYKAQPQQRYKCRAWALSNISRKLKKKLAK